MKRQRDSLIVAPPFVFRVYFDGGDSGHWAYGSFEIEFNGLSVRRHRMSFSEENQKQIVTSNVAEYLALIKALRWLQPVKNKEQYGVEVYGDSRLVICQVSGRYQCHKPHLAPLIEECRARLDNFGDWRIYWRGRNHNVARFGH